MNNYFFYISALGFTLGIFCSSFVKLGFSFFLLTIILAIIIFIYSRFVSIKQKILVLLAIFILAFGFGILRYEIKNIRNDQRYLNQIVGEKVILKGLIVAEPNLKDQGVEIILLGKTMIFQDKEISLSEKILVKTGLFPQFSYGDLIEIQGKIERPDNFMTENGYWFDYENYLAKDDIFYQISFAQAHLIASNQGLFFKTKLFLLKKSFIEKLNLTIKEPESSLLAGLLLGARNSLGQEWQDNFRKAGVSHIVALSGYNITIVAESIILLLSFLPQAFSISFGVLGIILFAIMTGGGATVLRASIMAILVLLAKFTQRKYDINRALVLAGLLMLMQNPKILVFDVSFQLSFLSTVALIFVTPLIENKFTFITKKYHLRELILSTIATQIFVLPFILYKMKMLSLFALFANALILPIIPLLMLLGFIIGILAFISVPITTPLVMICSLLLSYVLKIIYIFSHLPLSSIQINYFPLFLVVIIYCLFFIIFWQKQKKVSSAYL